MFLVSDAVAPKNSEESMFNFICPKYPLFTNTTGRKPLIGIIFVELPEKAAILLPETFLEMNVREIPRKIAILEWYCVTQSGVVQRREY